MRTETHGGSPRESTEWSAKKEEEAGVLLETPRSQIILPEKVTAEEQQRRTQHNNRKIRELMDQTR